MDKIKVLVVDDESRMRKLVHDFLSRSNYEVIEAADGEEAIDIFYADKSISLIILDVMMPKMDGWEACREIRKISKVPIIMLTAKSEESDELLGFELGVDEYISKPFSPRILVARVDAILRRTNNIGHPKIEKFSIVRECIGCYNRNPLDCLCGCLLHKVRIRRHVREVCLYRVCWHRLPAGIHLSDIFPVKRKTSVLGPKNRCRKS